MTRPLFSPRKPGLIGTIVDIVQGAVALGQTIKSMVKGEPPKRADEIFKDPLGVEAIRAQGMSTVYRSEPPRRGPNAERSDLP